MAFRDRLDAGQQLAARLATGSFSKPVVLALPRGGVPVAVPVADALGGELDVLVARKVGAPGHEEFGVGALAEGIDGGATVAVLSAEARDFPRADMAAGFDHAATEVVRRVARYRAGRALAPVRGRTVIVVDDGLATGITAEAALRSVVQAGADRVLLAVPVAAEEGARRLGGLADEVVSVVTDPHLGAVGAWYQDFHQVGDDEVVDLLVTPRVTVAVLPRHSTD
jgi:predicted phosphoribosyltransferase